MQTSQEGGEGRGCHWPCHWKHHHCWCPHEDSEEPTNPTEVILFFVYVRDFMTWLLSGAKSNTLAVCLECLQPILGSNFQKSHMCVTFGKHDAVIAIMKYQ